MIRLLPESLPLSLAALAIILATAAPAQNLKYPPARKSDQVDVYHGVNVPDPYRWLEDDRSAETTAWVNAENALTASYFRRIPYIGRVKTRLAQLQNFERYTVPFRKGPYYFFQKNDGLQNQNVVYYQRGLQATPKVLIDPNKFSPDGTSRLGNFSVSKDGAFAAFTISTGGSDWQEGHVLEVATGKILPDKLSWLKVGGFGWAAGGIFYSRYPAPKAGEELSSKNEFESVYFHKLRTDQSQDKLVYEDKAHPQRFHAVETSDDERFLLLYISDRGTGRDGNALLFRNLSEPGDSFSPIMAAITDDHYYFVDNLGNRFLIHTNAHAPNNHLVLYNPSNKSWNEVLPEDKYPLTSVTHAGGKLYSEYEVDVASQLYLSDTDGRNRREVKLPGIGTVGTVEGNPADPFVFYSFSSLNAPETIYRFDEPSFAGAVYKSPSIAGYDTSRFETRQVFYNSKDGTRVPMFLAYRKGIKLDGSNPTLLYAYGGFNVSEQPHFSPQTAALLEQGFVYASANLRGGGEYGEKWHQAGMRANKQNVFDDFVAAAHLLIDNHYTSQEKLAIRGISNGGLLIGATLNQHPELFKAAIAQAGVMDMLRLQKFTIGWNWVADYGSSDDPDGFKVLRAYSPIHNVRSGGKYPALLITTADHDDRVIPGHSFKYAATMQALADPANPVLIRIDTNSGHGPSSTTKLLEQSADIFSFLFYNLGVTPSFSENHD